MDVELGKIRGIGPARLDTLRTVGITTVRQLLSRLPVEYIDTKTIYPIRQLREGVPAAIEVRIIALSQNRFGSLLSTRARVMDESGKLMVIWYNQPWLANQLRVNDTITLYGKLEVKSSARQMICPRIIDRRGLLPVYKTLRGIPSKTYSALVERALSYSEGQWPDELPQSIKTRYALCEWNFAMRSAHMPQSREALEAARRRLAFEELLLYQVALWLLRSGHGAGVRLEYCDDGEYWARLTYKPTSAQRRVVAEIAADLKSERAMARLVQGDVGCGKTAVAFASIYLCFKSGFQSAMMAPTEVLARQHYENAVRTLEPLGASVGLLTGSMSAKEKALAHNSIADGSWNVIIGTHALISESVSYHKLGLVITDEQHRFGVRQRTALSKKGEDVNVLVMSATPIPRTLSLILYGDLDISIIDELPPGRKPVKTRIVPEEKRNAMYGFIKNEVKKGRQAYIICPLIEESEAIDSKAASELYEELASGSLKDVRLALAHGRMKSDELKQVLEDFRLGSIDVLVSTTVVEVGVDVPNASVMVVEGADLFGLAQLHQLRGRVGRGSDESWCFLMAESNERLDLLSKVSDGFIIAQKDMEYRGAGEMFGLRQSGLATAGAGFISTDAQLLKQTHDEARRLLKNPDSDDAARVINLARSLYLDRLDAISMN
ncbi:MAG: ATP-dependent DNA helicase RecG [Clostridia bacterium]|nr:ATP-dependent DNA helicase RecG [Clostridia bacterium]